MMSLNFDYITCIRSTEKCNRELTFSGRQGGLASDLFEVLHISDFWFSLIR